MVKTENGSDHSGFFFLFNMEYEITIASLGTFLNGQYQWNGKTLSIQKYEINLFQVSNIYLLMKVSKM